MDDMTHNLVTAKINSGRAYVLLGMLFIFQTLNFFDKLAFGVSAVPMMHEFGLNPKQFGLIGAAFFLFFAIGGTIVGLFFVGRFKTKNILFALAATWTVSQIPVYFATSIKVIIACRLLLGLGEGAALATAMTAAYEWFSPDRRNLPSAIILQGISAGFLIGGPLLTHITFHFGWRASFLACGAMSLLWLIGWVFIGKEGPLTGRPSAMGDVFRRLPTHILWLDRTVIGVIVVAFCAYWVVGMSAVWLPPYLRVGLGYAPLTTGWIISAIYVLQSPILLLGGVLTQSMRQQGWNARVSLGYSATLALLISGCAMLAAVKSPTGDLQIAFLALAFSVPSLTTIFGPVILAMIAPPSQRDRLVVLCLSATSISAFISTYGNGWIVSQFPADLHTGYATAFGVGGGVLLIGAIAAFTLVFPERSLARFKPYLTT